MGTHDTSRGNLDSPAEDLPDVVWRSLDMAPYGIAILDPEGRFLYFNSRLEEITGYSREEIPDIRTWFEKIYPEPAYRNRILQIHATVEMGSSRVRTREAAITRKDGEKRLCRFVSNLVLNGNRVVFVTDVTEEKRVRERIRVQTAALKAAANAVVITDVEGNIQWVNPAFTHLTGYTAEEVIGRNPRILKSGRHDRAFYENLWNTILSGEVWRGEIVNRRKDGTLYTEEMTITPVRDDAGRVMNFIAIKQDITGRKEIEEKLRESEERYRSIVENSHDGILIIGDRFLIEYANETLCRMLALPCDRVVGADFRLFLDDISKDLVVERYLRRQRGENVPARYEMFLRAGDGRRVAVESSIATLHDSKGRIERIIAQLRDVTERKKWEERMRRQAEEMTALFKTAQAAATLDMETVLREVTERAKELFNADDVILFLTEPNEKSLRVVYALHPHADLVLDRKFRFGEGIVGAVALRRKPEIVLDASDDPRSVHVPGTPVRHESAMYVPLLERGRVIGVIRVARSRGQPPFENGELRLLVMMASYVAATISNARLFEGTKKQAARLDALNKIITAAAREESLESLLSTALDCLLSALDLEIGAICGRGAAVTRKVTVDLTRVLDHAAQMKGLDFPFPLVINDMGRNAQLNFRLRPLLDILPKDSGLRAIMIVPILSGGVPHAGHVGGILVADSRPRNWSDEEVSLLQSAGAQLGFAIHRLKLIEDLQEALRIKDEMLQNVSHELRTPLTMLIGYTELMKAGMLGELSERQRKAVEVMNRHAHRLHFMVDRLILIGMLRDKGVEKVPVNIVEWLSTVIRDWQQHLQGSRFSLEYEVEGHVPAVEIDPDLLEEVVENLLDNAMKFSPDGGVIRVTLRREGEEAIISVSDNGIGIPEDKLDKIFDRFYQVSQGPARRFGGLGIGLALCKDIVEGHGGRIWAESGGHGKGATFHVALPLAGTGWHEGKGE